MTTANHWKLFRRNPIICHRLSANLLFLARSDAGKEQLNFEDVELKELITGLSANMKPWRRTKG